MDTYKTYINKLIHESPEKGIKTKLAEHLSCNPGFISQVLNGTKTNFNLDHIYSIGDFFNLSHSKKKILLMLWVKNKIKQDNHKDEIDKEIEILEKEKDLISKKIAANVQLQDEDKAVYYGHWAYPLIHIMISLEKFNTEEKIIKALQIPESFAKDAIKFLIEKNLITKEGKKLEIGPTRVHLDQDSPLLRLMHSNFRDKAIQIFQKSHPFNLNYSSVFTLSKQDTEKIRELILNFIQEKEDILEESSNEEVVILNIDYLKIN